MSVLKDVVGNE